jgi:glycosyltransferase involved in cell wall biosynthesis
MKILQVIPYFTPKRGGDVNVVYNISKHLMKIGHEITIVTTNFEFDKDYANSLDGINVIPFKSIANIGMMLFSPAMKKWLRNEIRKFDVIHLHTFRSYQNNLICYYTKKFGIPYVLQAHGSVLPFFARQRSKKIFDKIWGYGILKDAAKVIALNKTEVEQYKKMGVDEDKIEIVPNGIDLSEYRNLPRKGEFRSKYFIRENEKIILFLGRIHKIKGIDLLVQTFSDLSKEMDNIRLVIVGPNERFLSTLKRQIEDLKIEDKVLLTGPLYGEDKFRAYVDADVYVLPSVYETFPITVLEAIACGTPVVVTNRCGIVDFIDKIGFVVDYNRSELKEAIVKTFENRESRKKLQEEGRNLIEEKYNWDTIVDGIIDIYEKIKTRKKILIV